MKFIAFEGLDGAGKSTLIQGLGRELTRLGQAWITSREPGGTELGEEIREVLLRPRGRPPTAFCELLLYEAARAQHVEEVIRPALDAKKWVFCDRFTASSVAFQHGGRGLDRVLVNSLNTWAVGSTKPDLNILLDLPYETSRERRQSRSAEDRMESEAEDFHQRVRAAFLEQAKGNKDWLVLDARKKPEELLDSVMSDLRARGWI